MSTEDRIKELFAADAAAAPSADGLLDGTMRRVRRRRRQQAAWAVAGCVGVLAAAVVVAPGLGASEPPVVVAGPASSASSPAPLSPVGTVPPGLAGQPLSAGVMFGAGTAACAMVPGAERFALDGAVVAVAPPAGDIRVAGRPLSAGGSRVADVTVRVNDWLVGGDPASDTVVLRMTAPGQRSADGIGSAALPRYEVGTRLLISGRLLAGADAAPGGVQGLATNLYECESGAFYYSAPLAEAWADGVLPYNAWYSLYGKSAVPTGTAAP